MRKLQFSVILPIALLLAGCGASGDSQPETLNSPSESRSSTGSQELESEKIEDGTSQKDSNENLECTNLDESGQKILGVLKKSEAEASSLLKTQTGIYDELIEPYFNKDSSTMQIMTLFGIGAKVDECSASFDDSTKSWSFNIVGDDVEIGRFVGRYEFERVYMDYFETNSETDVFRENHIEETKTWAR